LSFSHTRPADVDGAAHRFPGVDFVLGHGAIVHREDAALLAEYRPNVSLDTAGFQVVHGRGEWSETLAFFKRRGLLRKLLFGTDWPVHGQHGPQRPWVERLAGGPDGPLTPAEARWLLDGNAREVLGLEPTTRCA
jgi:predicted TIM-barrel fold metal-dependent hydrolase